MKKYIEISEEDLARLVCGKCVKDSLRRDKWTGRITFLGYKCHPRNRLRDLLVEKLAIFDKENELARNALIERELEVMEFC